MILFPNPKKIKCLKSLFIVKGNDTYPLISSDEMMEIRKF